jgi:glyoxylase-like metal-dependent hydrolase (beta-lactamase superfamily II)
MRELLPGIYSWSWFSPEKGLDFNGFCVPAAGGGALIDPPPFTAEDETEIERLGSPRTIIVTNRHHLRRAGACRERFGAKVLIPAADSPVADFTADGTYSPGDALPGGFVAVPVTHGKTPGETALFHPVLRTLILGDALIGKPAGELTFLPDAMFCDRALAREGVRALLALDFVAVLVGDGVPILSGGKEAVLRAIER